MKTMTQAERAAAREIVTAIAAEFSAPSGDARRMIRNERLALQVQLRLRRDVAAQVAECRRVRAMWEGL